MKIKFQSPVVIIFLGVVPPAMLSIYFLFQFGIKTIFWDEWLLVPHITLFFTGGDLLPRLFEQQVVHFPFFPRLIILAMAYFTSYNPFFEIFVGWIFLTLSLVMLWLLVKRTYPENQWVIIPAGWLVYSFAQSEIMVWGFASVQLYLAILSVIASVYFLNKSKDESRWFVPALICGIIGTLSHFVGLSIWFIAVYNLLDLFKTRPKLYLSFLIVGTITLVKINPGVPDPFLSLNDPVSFVNFILIYLGGWSRIGVEFFQSFDSIQIATFLGIFTITAFLTLNLYHRFGTGNLIPRIIPWWQIASFGFLSAAFSGLGRGSIFGVEGAMTPRYVPISILFLVSILVLMAVAFYPIFSNSKTYQQKKLIKSLFVILLFLLFTAICISYISGWMQASSLNNRVSTGSSCLVEFETASDECLELLYPDPNFIREYSKILQKLCLGPFSEKCN